MKTKVKSVFTDPEVIADMSHLYDTYVVIPADKAWNHFGFACNAYYDNHLRNGPGDSTLR